MEPPALAARHLSKSFDGIRALDDAGIRILSGEIHGLLGQNGSGKSTLIHILAGYYAPDRAGELEVWGRQVRLPLRPDRSLGLGMRFVHQDLGLFPSLSVTDNVLVGEVGVGRGTPPVGRRARARVDRVLRRVGIDVEGSTSVGELPANARAWLAIGRETEALRAGRHDGRDGGLLVLDEPTAYLPAVERQRLFSMLRALAAAGTSVLLVSHDLAEVLEVADRVTVLRDGRTVATASTAGLSVHDLEATLTGSRPAVSLPSRRAPRSETVRASIVGLSGELVADVSFDIHEGEILGLTGAGGSGFEEVAYLLIGAPPARRGRLTLDRPYELPGMTPAKARRARLALVPADRLRDGGVAALSVGDNVSLPVLDDYGSGPLFRRRLTREAAALLARHGVEPSRPTLAYGALSGGNQKKALLAKWLRTAPALLLLDEPTRGIDAGARRQLWAMIRAAADRGTSVLCATSGHEELSALCDRVLVLTDGRLDRELRGSELTLQNVARPYRVDR